MDLRSGKKYFSETNYTKKFIKDNDVLEVSEEIREKYLTKYINYTRFELLHYSNIIPNQKWVCLDGLEIRTQQQNVGDRFNEYFLDTNSPLKIIEYDGKSWLIDGHHRFYRGLIQGYNYFLVERSHVYRPCNLQRSTKVQVFNKRPLDTEIENSKLGYKIVDNEKLNILSKILGLSFYMPDISKI